MLKVLVEPGLAQPVPPFLAPDYEGRDGEEEDEQHGGEREPGPEIADLIGEWEGEVSDDEGEAAGEVEEDTRFGGLGFVAVRNVGVEAGGGDLEAEDAYAQTDERRYEARLPNTGPEDDDPGGHKDRGESGQVQAVFWLADIVVPLRHPVHHMVTCSAREELSQNAANHQTHSQARTDGPRFQLVELRVYRCERNRWHDIDKRPSPCVIPEGESDGRVFQHVEGLQEIGGV